MAATLDKRRFLMASAALGILPATARAEAKTPAVEPFPMEAVTLLPSPWATAVETNAQYLASLEPDRFLHNFRVSAGLPPKGEVYGGWEAMGIAGHCLGHYLTACSLMYAQTRDPLFKARVAYTVADMAVIQAAHGDGYIGGTTVERDGKVIDGKIVYEEIRAHTITSHGFDINGGWVPIYTWHKVHAGLLDAHKFCGNAQALDVAVKMSDYLIGVLGGLSDDEMQQVLAAEHGGLNETFAETHVRTGDKRYLDMAKRIYHKAILDPLAAGRDELDGKHANTQIPKLIGLARLAEITGDDRYRQTADFFWQTVTRHHSYVIGGNSDGEHFGPPDRLDDRLTDKTCESCNSYNMLKLTRHLYQAQPDGKWFDYYERVHLNHILSHQHPQTGRFVYFMPLSANSQRLYSTATDSFWCCVGSGMESHAKHGDSIWWRQKDTAFVNLFIPSEVQWLDRKTKLTLTGDITRGEAARIAVSPEKPVRFTLAIRVPAWAEGAKLLINGEAMPVLPVRDGYVRVLKKWQAGDVVELTLPQTLRTEAINDNSRRVAFVKGPLVMAADMGPADGETPRAPVLVGDSGVGLVDAALTVAARPQPLQLKPFYAQHDRRSTVYFPLFTAEQWQAEEVSWTSAEQARAALDARTLDIVRLGEQQPETDHRFATETAEPTSRNGRPGRSLMWSSGRTFSFDIKVEGGAVLQVTYWGQDTGKAFDIEIDGQVLASEKLAFAPEATFRTVDYALPAAMTAGKTTVRVTFTTRGTNLEVFGVRSLRPAAAQQA